MAGTNTDRFQCQRRHDKIASLKRDAAIDDDDDCPLVEPIQKAHRLPTARPDDSDSDGVCNRDDICPGFDDNADGDNDGTPDGCDLCSGDDLTGDTDGDGVCNNLDLSSGDDASGDFEALDECEAAWKSTRCCLRSCVCSMAWSFQAIDATVSP